MKTKMKILSLRPLKHASILLCLALAAGCAQPAKTLYHWGSYQDQVYTYFKHQGEDVHAQIIALEADVQVARAKDTVMPPGFHAHLGMLYAQAGKQDQVLQQFETEKALFPESSEFMNFLIGKYTQGSVTL